MSDRLLERGNGPALLSRRNNGDYDGWSSAACMVEEAADAGV